MALEKANSDKQNLLANLYSLRAGISLACLYKRKADNIIGDAKRQRAQLISQSQVNLNGLNNRSEQAASQREQARHALSDKEAELDGERYFLRENRAERNKKIFFFVLFLFGFFAVLALTAYLVFFVLIGEGTFGIDFTKGSFVDLLYGWVYNWEAKSVKDYDVFYRLGFGGLSGFWGIVAIILILAGLGGIGFMAYKTISACIDLFSVASDCNANRRNIRTFTYEIESLERKLRESEKTKEKAIGGANSGARDLERVKTETVALIKQASAKATPYVQVAVAILAALDRTFTEHIDIRDWENLDYIIYCIETRRSDNMKEALLAVDRQRQTEQIVAAIEAAGREISRTLNSAMARLENKMVQCFTVISKQLTQQSRQLSAIGLKLDDIITSQSMNNALLTMQNATSMAMLGELNKISNATSYVASCVSAV